jgi:hypothetical protein
MVGCTDGRLLRSEDNLAIILESHFSRGACRGFPDHDLEGIGGAS